MQRAAWLVLCIALPLFAADPRDTRSVAEKALPQLRELARVAPLVAHLSPEDAGRAVVGEGVRLVDLPLRDLRAFAGGDVRKLLRDTGRVLHPVYVGFALRSEITVVESERGLEVVELGNVELIRRFAELRAGRAGEVLLRVPAVEAFFVAEESNGRLTLTPMHDIAGLRVGQRLDAANAFRALQPLLPAEGGSSEFLGVPR